MASKKRREDASASMSPRSEAEGRKEVPIEPGHFPADIHELYEVHEWKHASAILKHDFPAEWDDLLALLRAFRLRKSWIEKGGGNKTKLASWIDEFLGQRGWVERNSILQ